MDRIRKQSHRPREASVFVTAATNQLILDVLRRRSVGIRPEQCPRFFVGKPEDEIVMRTAILEGRWSLAGKGFIIPSAASSFCRATPSLRC
jgi:hypothetical protein